MEEVKRKRGRPRLGEERNPVPSRRGSGEAHMEEIYESWEWKLEEKLSDANDVVCRIHTECVMYGVKPELYQSFMQERLMDMIKRIGDAKEIKTKGGGQRWLGNILSDYAKNSRSV